MARMTKLVDSSAVALMTLLVGSLSGQQVAVTASCATMAQYDPLQIAVQITNNTGVAIEAIPQPGVFLFRRDQSRWVSVTPWPGQGWAMDSLGDRSQQRKCAIAPGAEKWLIRDVPSPALFEPGQYKIDSAIVQVGATVVTAPEPVVTVVAHAGNAARVAADPHAYVALRIRGLDLASPPNEVVFAAACVRDPAVSAGLRAFMAGLLARHEFAKTNYAASQQYAAVAATGVSTLPCGGDREHAELRVIEARLFQCSTQAQWAIVHADLVAFGQQHSLYSVVYGLPDHSARRNRLPLR